MYKMHTYCIQHMHTYCAHYIDYGLCILYEYIQKKTAW